MGTGARWNGWKCGVSVGHKKVNLTFEVYPLSIRLNTIDFALYLPTANVWLMLACASHRRS